MHYSSPYMHDLHEKKPAIRKRVHNIIFNFIGQKTIGSALDIGTRNPLTETLEKHFSIKIDSTDVDLDVGRLTGNYDTVFCFEVLEHLFNPLHMLLEIHKVLKDDGTLYLSTPKAKPYFLIARHHFHEFHHRELLDIFKRAGLKVNRIEYHRVRPFYKCIGFRPFLRFLFERKTMVELQKI